MKLFMFLKNLLVIGVVLIFASFVLLSFLIPFYGKGYFEKRLSRDFHTAVKLGKVHYLFPFGVKARDITVGDRLAMDELKAIYSFPLFENGAFIFDKVEMKGLRASLPLGGLALNKAIGKASDASSMSGGRTVSKHPSHRVKELRIVDGSFSGVDGVPFSLSRVNMTLQDFFVPPQPVQSGYFFQAVLNSPVIPFKDAEVTSRGWVNIELRDVRGDLNFENTDPEIQIAADITIEREWLTIKGGADMPNVAMGPQGGAGSKQNVFRQFFLGDSSGSEVSLKGEFEYEASLENVLKGRLTFKATGSREALAR